MFSVAGVADACNSGIKEIPSVAQKGPIVPMAAPATLLPQHLSKAALAGLRRMRAEDRSEGPSESSANIDDTEDERFQSTIPSLERFFEQMAAKAQLPGPPGTAAPSNWVLSLARSYRYLSKDKRRRGRLQALLQPSAQLGFASGSGLAGPMMENPGCASNTDDSGYEAGYETDADESELSEWESSGARARQGHKRKLEALVHLTMKLSVSEHGDDGDCEETPFSELSRLPPCKRTLRALGTGPVGLRYSLHADSASGFGDAASIPPGSKAIETAEDAPVDMEVG